jgi:hypothetical protein
MGNRQWWHCPVVIGDAEGVGELRGAETLLAGDQTRAERAENNWSTVRFPPNGGGGGGLGTRRWLIEPLTQRFTSGS